MVGTSLLRCHFFFWNRMDGMEVAGASLVLSGVRGASIFKRRQTVVLDSPSSYQEQAKLVIMAEVLNANPTIRNASDLPSRRRLSSSNERKNDLLSLITGSPSSDEFADPFDTPPSSTFSGSDEEFEPIDEQEIYGRFTSPPLLPSNPSKPGPLTRNRPDLHNVRPGAPSLPRRPLRRPAPRHQHQAAVKEPAGRHRPDHADHHPLLPRHHHRPGRARPPGAGATSALPGRRPDQGGYAQHGGAG